MSFVPNFSLFFIRIIFIFESSYSQTLYSSLNIFNISTYFELHLHRMISPTLKLIRSGGAVHLFLLDNFDS